MIEQTKVSLRIVTSALTCAEISSLLGVTPHGCVLRDNVYGLNPSEERHYCMWTYEAAMEQTENLSSQLGNIAGLLKERREAFASIAERAEVVDHFCMLAITSGQGMCCIDADASRRVSALGLNVVLDIYGGDE